MRILLLLPLAFTSCTSMAYHRDFAAATKALPADPEGPQGPWKGTWLSDVNGHTGPIWCIVNPNPDQAGLYDFRYRAGWGVLQFGDYTHTLPAEVDAEGRLILKGEMELPAGIGVYAVDGELTPAKFEADYRSKGDHGSMSLRRP